MDEVSFWKPSERDLSHSEHGGIGNNTSNFNKNYVKPNFSNKFNIRTRTSSLKRLNNLENTLIEHMGKRRSYNIVNNLNQFIYNTRRRTSAYKITQDNDIPDDNNKLYNNDLNKHIFYPNNVQRIDISDMDTTTSSTSNTDTTHITIDNTVDINNTKIINTSNISDTSNVNTINIANTGSITDQTNSNTSNLNTDNNPGNVEGDNKNKNETESKSMTKAEFQRRIEVITSWYNKLPIIKSRKDNSIQIPRRVTVLPKEKKPILIEGEYGLDVKFNLTILIDILTCYLCKGLLHNAQTIRDCMHTFCKSCLILSTFENGLVCPMCFSPILSSITEGVEPDTNIQTIVDKLFPHFAQNEQKQIDEMKERIKNYKMSLQDDKISDIDTTTDTTDNKKLSEVSKSTDQDKTIIEQDHKPSEQDSKTIVEYNKDVDQQYNRDEFVQDSKTTIEQNIQQPIQQDNKIVEQDINSNNKRLISIEQDKKTEAKEVNVEGPKQKRIYRKNKVSDSTEAFLNELNKFKDLTKFFETVSCLALVHVSDNQMNGMCNDMNHQMEGLGDRLHLDMSVRYPRKYICVPKRVRVLDIVRYLTNELLLEPKYNVVFMLKNLVLQKRYTIEFIFHAFKIDASKCVVFRYKIIQQENISS